MKHSEEILVVFFDYITILFKDSNQKDFAFLDMMKKILLNKIKTKEETEDKESTPFSDKLHENILKD